MPENAEPQREQSTEPSEYALLARIIANASSEDRTFLYSFLKEAAATPFLDLSTVALHEASHALHLGIQAEDIENHPEDFEALTFIRIDQGWLYRFVRSVFDLVRNDWKRENRTKKSVTPDLLMDLLGQHLEE